MQNNIRKHFWKNRILNAYWWFFKNDGVKKKIFSKIDFRPKNGPMCYQITLKNFWRHHVILRRFYFNLKQSAWYCGLRVDETMFCEHGKPLFDISKQLQTIVANGYIDLPGPSQIGTA